MSSRSLSSTARRVARRFGFDVVRVRRDGVGSLPPDFDDGTRSILQRIRGLTMTSPERVFQLCRSVEYVIAHEIPGAFVECGVWRGGSMMAVGLTLQRLGVSERDMYLFDTFAGMPAPTSKDVSIRGESADEKWRETRQGDGSDWCLAGKQEVRANMRLTGYPEARLHLIEGKVEETLPAHAPAQIAVLRLDTDWYESTRHELEHLFPRLSAGGVLIVDDYGHWQGARRAVDEYIAKHNLALLLCRIDETGRVAIKPANVG